MKTRNNINNNDNTDEEIILVRKSDGSKQPLEENKVHTMKEKNRQLHACVFVEVQPIAYTIFDLTPR
jgi:hypothetical protein